MQRLYGIVKGTKSTDTIWAESREDVQRFPFAGFVCLFYQYFCDKCQFSSVQPLDRLGRWGGQEGRFHRDPPVSSAGAPCEQVWHGQGSPFIDVVHPAFPLLTPASPTLQGALKDSRGEAVLVWGMPAPCKFLSLGSCQKWLLLTHKEVDLDPRWSGVTNIFCFNLKLLRMRPRWLVLYHHDLSIMVQKSSACHVLYTAVTHAGSIKDNHRSGQTNSAKGRVFVTQT